jgi:hypothetical protein
MARRATTYALRLAVEGGGQVRAELVSVGQSGEQSLKRIESAGERASGGLKGLGCQAELLRTGIGTLGGALIRDAADGALLSSHGPSAAGVGIAGRMLFDESASTFYMTGTSAVHQVIAHRAIPGAAAMPGTASEKRSSSQAMT